MWQRAHIKKSFITLMALIQGVPWRGLLGPFLFNIYLNSSFYLPKSSGVCNFDDGTTLKHPAKPPNQNFKSKLQKLNFKSKLQKLNFKSKLQIKPTSQNFKLNFQVKSLSQKSKSNSNF